MLIKPLIAFVHIEKAAGTTFTSILQRNFLFRHCSVKPLKKKDKKVFSSESMKIIYRINPFVSSISGHSVMPFSDLEKIVPVIKYITILREPYARYISHYQYQVERMGSTYTFEDFLEADFTHNFQTKKIAGEPDLEKAKEIIKKFFFVGILEEFDQFLSILKKKFLPEKFHVFYRPLNVAKKNKIRETIISRMDKYKSEIMGRNLLDLELYYFVKNNLFENEKIKYLGVQQTESTECYYIKPKMIKLNIYWIYRKGYYHQMIKFFRLINGLPIHGSY